MGIKVNCEICGKEESVSPSRYRSYKTCSISCSSILKKKRTKLNCICKTCGKPFHLKESQIKRYNRNMGIFCSIACSSEHKKSYYLGQNNPNFRCRQYDQDGYRISHYPLKGRMKEHLYVAISYLGIEKIPAGLNIHHRDCNIYNNTPENLAILNSSDHRWIHKQFGSATLWAYSNNKVTLEELLSWSNDSERAARLLPINLISQYDILKHTGLLDNISIIDNSK